MDNCSILSLIIGILPHWCPELSSKVAACPSSLLSSCCHSRFFLCGMIPLGCWLSPSQGIRRVQLLSHTPLGATGNKAIIEFSSPIICTTISSLLTSYLYGVSWPPYIGSTPRLPHSVFLKLIWCSTSNQFPFFQGHSPSRKMTWTWDFS